MKNKKILISYLTYVNDKNFERRYPIFKKTFEEFKKLKSNKNLYFLSIDNNSSNIVKKELIESNIFNATLHLDENFYDMSLLYYTSKFAIEENIDYIFYTYDDFEFFNYDFSNDCISFLESNEDVHSIRMPIYDINNINYYNSEITSKSKNPDATRHFNQIAKERNQSGKLIMSGPYKENKYEFYKINWHYTSRPTMWRTKYFNKIFNEFDKKVPVMQNFEGIAMKYFYNNKMNAASINLGVNKTFKQSERIESGGHNYFNNVYLDKNKLNYKYSKLLKRL
jgi:hypothetical protein